MKPHYFDQPQADADDFMLKMAQGQGYVPTACLLGGMVVMAEVQEGRDPCAASLSTSMPAGEGERK